MSKNKPIRNKPAVESPPVYQPGAGSDLVLGLFPRERLPLIILFFTVTLGSFTVWAVVQRPPDLDEILYEKVAEYLHDTSSFTQGLIYDGGYLYESTGRYGQSKLRKISLEDGKVVKEVSLSDKYFGEGLCKVGDKLIQLTWQENKGFVYDLDLNQIDEFSYDIQGWGVTYDGKDRLIISDGTSWLYFMDPKTYEIKDKVLVRLGGSRVRGLNELEFINNHIYANVWKDDIIYQIQPTDGKVVGQINFQNLYPISKRPGNGLEESVMNGIAIRPNGNVLVTGKLWPKIYEVKLRLAGPKDR